MAAWHRELCQLSVGALRRKLTENWDGGVGEEAGPEVSSEEKTEGPQSHFSLSLGSPQHIRDRCCCN